ncbi:MAG TPA: sugar phosphate isomerase/epimerase family protein [Pirellulales bacterium]|nr:sugar phosphate isomerase/epimerase family protein [Pirellulales bacterium]
MSHSSSSENRPASAAEPKPRLDRRELLGYATAFGTTFLAAQGLLEAAENDSESAKPQPRKARSAHRRFEMKKSINLWAFPYPQQMSLEDCFALAKDAGFDGVEVNFALEGELSAESKPAEIEAIGKLADKVGIAISGVCSFLYWPYSLTHNDPERRKHGLQLARQMIQAAGLLGTENLLVVPGAVYIPWLEGAEPVPNDVCHERARAAISELVPIAERAGVYLNMENIFANGFLFSPQEIIDFVDSFGSKHVQVHFDTGNIMEYQFPEHWVKMLGKRIKNIHFKEWDKRTHEFNLHTFRTLLDGTTNWPAVIEALDQVGYRGYLTFEYFHPFQHYPEALIYQTSDALDRMLGRKHG